jgi:hypothetical protein
LLAVTATTVALFGPLAFSANADTAPGNSPTLQQQEQTASAQAASSGNPVTVDAATTPTTTLTAEPDGSFEQDVSNEPVRAQRGGAWVPLDATLTENSDGTYSPVTTTDLLTLSGGGTGPLATVRDGDRSLSLSWPQPLPAPSVSGDTALYSDVLPDVDLKVRADEQGGFSEVLIVKTPSAAQNPDLATLVLATSTSGVDLGADAAGNITATDTTTGAPVFGAPAPLMWDSASGVGSTAAQTRARNADLSATDTPATSPSDDQDLSDGPAPGSQQAPVSVSLSGGDIRLQPDASLLTTDAAQNYPVYIDPDVSVDDGSSAFTYIQSGYPGTSHYNDTNGDDPGVGYQGAQYATGKERTYYQFDIGSSMDSKTIDKAELDVTQTYASDHGCTNYTVTEKSTGHISSATTWDNQPDTNTQTDTHAFTGSYNDGCAGDTKGGFTVTSSVGADGDGVVTYELVGDENDSTAFKRFAKSAKLEIDYDTPPRTPTATESDPEPVSPKTYGCDGSPYGYIGKRDQITLSAHVSDPDGDDQNIRGQFALWDDGGDGTSGPDNIISTGDSAGNSSTVPGSGGTVHITFDTSKIKNGHLYGWQVRTDDGIDQSSEADNCHFWYDSSAPTGLAVTTSDFPADGSGTVHAGDTATFHLSATDLAPSGDRASGLDHFDWSLSSSADLDSDGGTHVGAGSDGTATLKLPLTAWGSTTLWVSAVDNAGNQSQPVATTFYVPDAVNGQAHPGDVDGDGHPDLLGGDSATGDLDLISPTAAVPTAADGSPAPAVASDAADGPADADGNPDWPGALIAHRSSSLHSSTGTWVDDLWAYENSHLWLYANNINSNGGLAANANLYYTKDHRTAINRPACSGTCTGYGSDWSGVTQLIAPGDVNQDGNPDLITVEGTKLWLFLGGGSSGQFSSAVSLSGSSWSDYTLIAPGDTTGDGVPDLWVRKNDTGEIYSYPITASGGTYALGTRAQIGDADFPAAKRPLIVSTGDQDGDGLPDLYSLHTEDTPPQLWANQGTPPDTNGFTFGTHDVVDDSTLWADITNLA